MSASLQINPDPQAPPDLVDKYTEYLEEMWETHQVLATRFTRSGEVALTPEQLRTLRSLGYIQ